MSDPREWPDPTGESGYPANTDPAYSGQYWTPNYYGGQNYGYGAPPAQPTEQLPAYWQPGPGYPPGPPPPPPEPPRSPRWLWILAAAAVLLVAGLVAVLVIVSNSTRESTTVAPMNPATTAPRLTTPTRVPTPPRPPMPSVTIGPAPTVVVPGTEKPDLTTAPAGAETVVYSVTGEGRAINITYVDTGGVMQTEFNVALPWSKEVSLAPPAKTSASVAVVNVGRDVTCSVSVNGTQVRQRSGRGLTICSGLA